MSERRRVVLLTDVDKVQVAGPPSMGTIRKLYRGSLVPVNYQEAVLREHSSTGMVAFALLKLIWAYHAVRWPNRDGQQSLPMFREAAKDNGIDMKVVASSGRETPLHGLTQWQLRKLKEKGIIDELRHNPGYNSPSHKARLGDEYLEEEPEVPTRVILLDDDTLASLTFAQVDPRRSYSYLQRNLSNHPGLMAKAGVTLPPNVQIVDSFKQAAHDFRRRFDSAHW
jgi:hypothetical protein